MNEALSHHYERATMLLAQNRFDRAEGELRALLALDPDHAWAHTQLAWCLGVKRQWNEALSESIVALGISPESPMCHRVQGTLLRLMGRLAEARLAIRRAIQLAPEWAVLYGDLAAIYQGQNRWSLQLEAAERGLFYDPNELLCTQMRATALVHLGKSDEAIKTMRGALEIDPENSDIQSHLGWVLRCAGRSGDAYQHYSEATRLDPNSKENRKGLIESFKMKGVTVLSLLLGTCVYFYFRLLFETENGPHGWALFALSFLISIVGLVLDSNLENSFFELLFVGNPFWRRILNQQEKWKAVLWSIVLFLTFLCLILSFGIPWFLSRGVAFFCCIFLLAWDWSAQPARFLLALRVVVWSTILLAVFSLPLYGLGWLGVSDWVYGEAIFLARNLDIVFLNWAMILPVLGLGVLEYRRRIGKGNRF